MTKSLPEKIQDHVAELRDTISYAKAACKNVAVNFVMYETLIAEAEKAVREQDTAAMLRLLPELQEMSK